MPRLAFLVCILATCHPTFGANWLTMGESWKYLDTGETPIESWISEEFDDQDWKSGQAPLGYGDSHVKHQVSYGENEDDKHISTYFRRTVTIKDTSTAKQFQVQLICDDGCVAYINGKEVLRFHMPDGEIKATTTSSVTSSGSAERHRFTFLVDPSNFKPGPNVVAVRVHQQNPTSSDLAFDMSLASLSSEEEIATAKNAQQADRRIAQSNGGGGYGGQRRAKRRPRPLRPELEG